MRYSRSIRLLLPVITLMAMITACGGDNGNDEATPASETETSSTSTETVTEVETEETATPVETSEDASPTEESTEDSETPDPTNDDTATDEEPEWVPFEVEVLVTELEIPWEIVFLPDGRKFVTERPGRLRVLDEEFNLDPEPIMEFDVVHEPAGEAGLLGMTLHPEFEENSWIYIYYTYDEGNGMENRVVRFDVDGDQLTNETVIIEDLPGAFTHNGGRLKFGPDDKLYVTLGDAQIQEFAQDPEVLVGKVLRLNDDGSFPEDNPFEDSPVYAIGLRNPQGITWHPETGVMYTNQHGPTGNDEFNRIEPGHNYGWPDMEGYEGEQKEEFTLPVAASGDDTWAPSGSTFVEGDTFPQWQNLYLMAGLRSVTLYWFDVSGEEPEMAPIIQGEYGRLRTVVEGPDGFIYILTSNRDQRQEPAPNDDRLLRLVPTES